MKPVLCRYYGLIFLLFLLPLPSWSATSDAFTLQLKWTPQAQFMGYFVANELGFYDEEGLEVKFLRGGNEVVPIASLQSGQADAVIEWLPTALEARKAGFPIINVAQIFQHSGLLLVCHRDRDIKVPEDLHDKTISTWFSGNEIPLIKWFKKLNLSPAYGKQGIKFIEQNSAYADWTNGRADCVSAMSYNEYWSLLENGVPLSSTTIFRLNDLGFSLMEDGIYIDERRMGDPVFSGKLVRFLRASLRGWQYAVTHEAEAVELLLQKFPEVNEEHQKNMANEIIRLVDAENFSPGLLRIESYDQTLSLLNAGMDESEGGGSSAWTHRYWYEIDKNNRSYFSIELRYRLQQVLSHHYFYLLDLIGTLAFGIAGFARAQERNYGIWGALVVTSLPAVGGGTLRDVLVGGDRHPPFIFTDPTYIYIVMAIVIIGSVGNLLIPRLRGSSQKYPGLFLIIDTIGLAAFSIIGAKVAIVAQLEWFWIPALAALTCAGGGVLLDIFTNREPLSFHGKIYEEIAVFGGLIFAGMLYFGNHVDNMYQYLAFTIVITFFLVFFTRIAVVHYGWTSPLLRSRVES